MGFLNFLVYAGIWGYNGVLAMPCISCVFYAFGKMSFLLGLVDTIAVGFAQYALRATMTLQVCKSYVSMSSDMSNNELWYFTILLLITLHFFSEWSPRFHRAFCPNIITCVGNKWYQREFIPGGKDELPRKTVLRMAFGEERYQYVLRLLLSVILIY